MCTYIYIYKERERDGKKTPISIVVIITNMLRLIPTKRSTHPD